MWNCVSKSLKGIFEKNRRKCWNIPATKVTQKSKCDNCILRLSPEIVDRINRFYGYYKSCCSENASKGKQHKERKAKGGFSTDSLQFNWLESVKNLGIITAIGLFFIQPFSHRRIFFPTDLETDSLSKSSKCLATYLTNIVPNTFCYILPEINVNKINKAEAAFGSEAASNNDSVQTGNADNLEKAHDTVLSALNNWLGTECMQLGKHKEAVNYFKQAAEANNAAALFNLGICHETGSGTTRDLKMAAKLYQKASDLGHATAMFNLGVFHVHGWGGVEMSQRRAKELFRAAADLGQEDAVKLLHLADVEPEEVLGDVMDLKENTSHVQNNQEHSEPSTSSGRSRTNSARENFNIDNSDDTRKVNVKEIEPKMTDPTLLWYQVLDIPITGLVEHNSHKKIEQLSSVDSGVLDLSSEDDINVFV